MKKNIRITAALLCLLMLAGCAGGKTASAELRSSVTRDAKYNAAVFALSPEELADAGFALGDGCDVEFENGYSLTDVPYLNGYYVKNGEPVIVAYPGFDSVQITLNNCGIWEQAGLSEGDGVTIRLHEAGAYAAVQETLGQVYSFDFSKYDSPEQFCNFRALSGGELKEDFLYRGASPVDNSRSRAPYTDALLAEQGIAFVVDLADSAEDMASYRAAEDFASPYTAALYEEGRVALLDMGSAYQDTVYQQKLVEGLRAMMQAEGPVYIHCMEGKDRTGFVCLLLEALAGADYEEMLADYMKTYENYYSVSPAETPEKYEAIAELYFDAFVSYLHGTEDTDELRSADYTQDAADYLTAGGMSKAETEQLRDYITQ